VQIEHGKINNVIRGPHKPHQMGNHLIEREKREKTEREIRMTGVLRQLRGDYTPTRSAAREKQR